MKRGGPEQQIAEQFDIETTDSQTVSVITAVSRCQPARLLPPHTRMAYLIMTDAKTLSYSRSISVNNKQWQIENRLHGVRPNVGIVFSPKGIPFGLNHLDLIRNCFKGTRQFFVVEQTETPPLDDTETGLKELARKKGFVEPRVFQFSNQDGSTTRVFYTRLEKRHPKPPPKDLFSFPQYHRQIEKIENNLRMMYGRYGWAIVNFDEMERHLHRSTFISYDLNLLREARGTELLYQCGSCRVFVPLGADGAAVLVDRCDDPDCPGQRTSRKMEPSSLILPENVANQILTPSVIDYVDFRKIGSKELLGQGFLAECGCLFWFRKVQYHDGIRIMAVREQDPKGICESHQADLGVQLSPPLSESNADKRYGRRIPTR